MAPADSKRDEALEHLGNALFEVARAIAKLRFDENKAAAQIAATALEAARQAVQNSEWKRANDR